MNKLITERQQAFLDAYRYSGMVKEAAEAIGCSRELHYGAMRTSEAYREAFALVQSDVAVELEEEARRRAVDGVKVPILYRGKVIGYDTRRSDALLIFLLEANNPEKFAGIKEELGRNEDFGVRWDREEVGRPTLSRMMGPMPPMPPRPPRPPRPPVGEWGGDEVLEGVADVGTAARPEPDPELIRRWAAMDLSPCESGLRNAPPLESDGVDEESAAEMPFDLPFEMEGGGSDDGDAGFCVRWGEDEDHHPEAGSTPLPWPRPFRNASTPPTERRVFADCRPRRHRAICRAPPIAVPAHLASTIVLRRAGSTELWWAQPTLRNGRSRWRGTERRQRCGFVCQVGGGRTQCSGEGIGAGSAAGSTGRMVTETPPRSSGTLAGPARCWPPEAMSALEPWNTFRVQARTGCGGPSTSERFPCDSHGSGERGPRCWSPKWGAGRWPWFPERKRLRRGQRPRWTGIGRHVGLRKDRLSATSPPEHQPLASQPP